eukprot:PhF_6_TR548/c0_g1_i1/m.499
METPEEMMERFKSVPPSYPNGVKKGDIEEFEKRILDVSEAIKEIMNSDVCEYERRREKREQERKEKMEATRREHMKTVHKRRYNLDYSRFNDDAMIERVEKSLEEAEKLKVLPPLDVDSLTHAEKIMLEQIQKMKKEGNELFNSGKFEEAFEKYNNGVGMGGPDQSLLLTLRNNRAMAALKLEKYETCVEDASWVLGFEPKNVKALQRRAAAYLELHKIEDALNDLHVALQLSTEANNVTIEAMLQRATAEHAEDMKESQMSLDVKQRVDAHIAAVRQGFNKYEKVREVTVHEDGHKTMSTDEDIQSADTALIKAITELTKLLFTEDVESIEVRLRKQGVPQQIIEFLKSKFITNSPQQLPTGMQDISLVMASMMFLSNAIHSSFTFDVLGASLNCIVPFVCKSVCSEGPLTLCGIRLIATLCKHDKCVSQIIKSLPSTTVKNLAKVLPSRAVCLLVDALLKTRHSEYCGVLEPVAMTAVEADLTSTHTDIGACRDALACLLRISLVNIVSTAILDTITRTMQMNQTDSFVQEAVLSIAHNAIVQRKDIADRNAVILRLHSKGLSDCLVHLIMQGQGIDTCVKERSWMLLNKMVAEPCVRKHVFPTPETLLNVVESSKVFSSSESTVESALTLLARVFMSKDVVSDVTPFMVPHLVVLLKHPRNVRISGNAALVVTHLASDAPEVVASKIPGLVEALLETIKNARSSSFKVSESKSAAQKDGILNASQLNKLNENGFSEEESLSAQKNAAIALGKLAKVNGCRETLQRLQGFEILHTVIKSTSGLAPQAE